MSKSLEDNTSQVSLQDVLKEMKSLSSQVRSLRKDLQEVIANKTSCGEGNELVLFKKVETENEFLINEERFLSHSKEDIDFRSKLVIKVLI